MNKSILILLFFTSTFLSFSQSKVEYYSISLKSKKDLPVESTFYVENVYDGRQYKDNIGTVHGGMFNHAVLVNFNKSFTEEISEYLSLVYPKQENKRKISISIIDLYISELAKSYTTVGYATIVIDVIEHKDTVDYVVGRYAAIMEAQAANVTPSHDNRLRKVIGACLDSYNKTKDEDKKNIVFDRNQKIENKMISNVPSKGIYLTYSDVLNNKPISDSIYEITNNDDKYYLLNKSTNQKELNYFGFSDGSIFYLNVSKYADQKYYAKTDIFANKYYVENIVYNTNSVAALGGMFGLVGSLAASAASTSDIPMLIDCYSGQPIFLSKSEIKTLLEPYPVLFKEYNSTKKTDLDKKNIIKKYYEVGIRN